jgi:hypothetical protein
VTAAPGSNHDWGARLAARQLTERSGPRVICAFDTRARAVDDRSQYGPDKAESTLLIDATQKHPMTPLARAAGLSSGRVKASLTAAPFQQGEGNFVAPIQP